MGITLDEYAKNKIRGEMKVRGITSKQMCELLQEKLNIQLKEQSFNNKISRSNFNATFFFQCMYALNIEKINFELQEIDLGVGNE